MATGKKKKARKAKAKPTAKATDPGQDTPEAAARDLAGEEAPKIKTKMGGKREGAGRKPKWEPEPGQRFSMEEVLDAAMKSRAGGESPKEIKEAEEWERRSLIMVRNLQPDAFEYLVQHVVNAPFEGAKKITGWGGWSLTKGEKSQEEWLVQIWGPYIRWYIPYFLAKYGHLAICLLLSAPVVMHKAGGYAEFKRKTIQQQQQQQGQSTMGDQRTGTGREVNAGR